MAGPVASVCPNVLLLSHILYPGSQKHFTTRNRLDVGAVIDNRMQILHATKQSIWLRPNTSATRASAGAAPHGGAAGMLHITKPIPELLCNSFTTTLQRILRHADASMPLWPRRLWVLQVSTIIRRCPEPWSSPRVPFDMMTDHTTRQPLRTRPSGSIDRTVFWPTKD